MSSVCTRSRACIICRVGQNCISAPYMTVCIVISLLKIQYVTYCMYILTLHIVYYILYRDGSYGVGVLYVVSYLSRIYPYFSNCSV